ncbi:hypothetical protein EJB05_05726, partial [Eragrostis curvula]
MKFNTHALARAQAAKIQHIADVWGWPVCPLDATETIRAHLTGSNHNAKAIAWERDDYGKKPRKREREEPDALVCMCWSAGRERECVRRKKPAALFCLCTVCCCQSGCERGKSAAAVNACLGLKGSAPAHAIRKSVEDKHMAQVSLSYVKTLALTVDQLGLIEPDITCEAKPSGMFHAVIEVPLVNWVDKGFRGPRQFTGVSSSSARRAIRKAAHAAVKRLVKDGLLNVKDFSKEELTIWKKKVCKEIAEERDEFERNYAHLEKKRGKLLAENARMKVKLTRLKEQISYCMEDQEENQKLATENKVLKRKISAMMKQLAEARNEAT